jgi:LPS-assembly lipoprotein
MRSRREHVAGLLSLLLLGGCGFRPLNGAPAQGESGLAGPDVQAAIRAIRIAPLTGRPGQQMHNLLRDRLNPGGQPLQPAYLLRVRLEEEREEVNIRLDETATRVGLKLTAIYELTSQATQDQVLSGHTRVITSYNILQNKFATIASEQDARERALERLADQIAMRLTAHFAA